MAAAHRVMVWRLPARMRQSQAEQQWEVLDEAERARANRFRDAEDRSRFVVARAGLRQMLARHLHTEPTSLAFASTAHGKLLLAGHPELQFNSSHSGDWVLLALSTGAPVGVDVERVRPDLADESRLGDVWTADDHHTLAMCDPVERAASVSKLWTAKEAYSKALGLGLLLPFKEIAVRLNAHGHPCAAASTARGRDRQDCALVPLAMPAGYVACLAYLGPLPELVLYDAADGIPDWHAPSALSVASSL